MKCPHCQTICNGSKARAQSTCLWLNAWGSSYRVTCLVCGQVSDCTTTYTPFETTYRVVQQPRTVDGEAVERSIQERIQVFASKRRRVNKERKGS